MQCTRVQKRFEELVATSPQGRVQVHVTGRGRIWCAAAPSPARFKGRHAATAAMIRRPHREKSYSGAPGEIRTPDPQIRSLVLYPAELRARCALRGKWSGRQGRRDRAHRYRLRPRKARHAYPFTSPRWRRPSRPRPLATPGVELHRAVRDGEAEGRADGALDQADLAAVGPHQFGHDGEAEPDAAGAR